LRVLPGQWASHRRPAPLYPFVRSRPRQPDPMSAGARARGLDFGGQFARECSPISTSPCLLVTNSSHPSPASTLAAAASTMGKQEKAAAASTPLLPLQIGRLNPATGGAEVGAGGAERTRIESFPQPNGLGSNFFPQSLD